jgi:Acyl-CoA dehydrogenase, C-terminal domain
MNLELSVDEESLVSEGDRIFDQLLPVTRFRSDPGASTWRALVSAGWADLGANVELGLLEVGTASGLFRSAGRHLLVEQFVTSGYLLSALIAHVPDRERPSFVDRLARHPGVVCGDGRQLELPIGELRPGLCFGVEEPFDLYKLAHDADGHLLLGVARLETPIEAGKVAGLALGIGHVTPPPASWQEAILDLDGSGLDQINRTALLFHCAGLIGAAEALLELTRDHTLNRVQFGVPIASFQAIKHALADVLVGNEVAWSALLCALADGAEDINAALIARILTVEAALAAARAGAQYHGGIGFTWESDAHLYLKVLIDGAQRFGSPDDMATALGRSIVKGVKHADVA